MENCIEALQSLFERAIEGGIKYNEFLREWERVDDGSEISNVLFEDLADGICHTPGFFTKPGIDIERWKLQREYFVLVCDKLMLRYIKTHDSSWLKNREDILKAIGSMNFADIDFSSISKLVAAKFV